MCAHAIKYLYGTLRAYSCSEKSGEQYVFLADALSCCTHIPDDGGSVLGRVDPSVTSQGYGVRHDQVEVVLVGRQRPVCDIYSVGGTGRERSGSAFS